MLLDKKNVHFSGIGGIGMSGIAIVLSEMGYNISGSDLVSNDLTRRLEMMGAKIFKAHAVSSLPDDTQVLVYSSSINKDNPELIKAARRKIRTAHRAEMLGELLNARKGIAVTGTHGKTTTTALIAVILEDAGLDPTVMIGGEVARFKGNAKFGNGKYLVAEADESDSSFLKLRPFCSVITNIEMEHMDHYKTLDDALGSYKKFIDNTKKGGIIFYNHDDENIKNVLKGFHGRKGSFGFAKDAEMRAVDIRMEGFRTSFRCVYKGKLLGEVELRIPGRHNVLNCLAAILAALETGIGFKTIANSVKTFTGVKRRFQLRADADNVMLIDDYAHHPTEIRAVLKACRNWKRKRVIVIFQPHRYTRTLCLADDFGRCFAGADKLILTDIYAASEAPIEGVSVKNIYDRARAAGMDDVSMMRKDAIADYIMKIKRRGDMILVLGAGDIKEVADELAERLNEKKNRLTGRALKEFRKIVKGRLLLKENLAARTSFRIGGPAEVWAQPRDVRELRKILLFAKNKKIPIFVMGRGTNILAKDSGFKGIVIHLGSAAFKNIRIKTHTIRVGAGYSLPQLIRLCCDKGLSGMESLVGIPGTVGGAIYMNAGGSTNPIFKNIGDFVTALKVMNRRGGVSVLKKDKLRFGYRSSNLHNYVILEAMLKLGRAGRATLNSRCLRFLKMKRTKQVLDRPSAGCVFKNPKGFQFTCGQMIDMLGLKGMRSGGAEISVKHANFIINRKNATSEDVLSLIEFIKDKVNQSYNIPLELEIEVV